MAIIGGFAELEVLKLDGSDVTDRGFAHVANLKQLSLLDMPVSTSRTSLRSPISRDSISSAYRRPGPLAWSVPDPRGPSSLEPLHRLTKLTQLILGSTWIEDRELAVIAGSPKLHRFMVGGRG